MGGKSPSFSKVIQPRVFSMKKGEVMRSYRDSTAKIVETVGRNKPFWSHWLCPVSYNGVWSYRKNTPKTFWAFEDKKSAFCISKLFPIDFVVWQNDEKQKVLQQTEEALKQFTKHEKDFW